MRGASRNERGNRRFPFDAADIPDSWCDSLTALMDDPAVVAMGEIGVDATKPSCPDLARQTAVFEEQARIAVGRDLPIVIHSQGIKENSAKCAGPMA